MCWGLNEFICQALGTLPGKWEAPWQLLLASLAQCTVHGGSYSTYVDNEGSRVWNYGES